jgi:hypothetical protein
MRKFKISFRSQGDFDVNQFAREILGGHRRGREIRNINGGNRE